MPDVPAVVPQPSVYHQCPACYRSCDVDYLGVRVARVADASTCDCRACHQLPAVVPQPAYDPLNGGHMHRHGTPEPGWITHSHLGGGAPHRHDPETNFQVPECGQPTLLGGAERPCQMDEGHDGPHLRRPERLDQMTGRPASVVPQPDPGETTAEAVPHDFNLCRCDQVGRCLTHCATCSCRRDAYIAGVAAARERARIREGLAAIVTSNDATSSVYNRVLAFADLLGGDGDQP